MREITTYSFISGKAIETLNLPAADPRRQAITLLNPLGEEYSTLRTQLMTSMLTVLATNYSRKIPAVRFFEVSKRFVAKSLPLTEQPDEIPVLCLGLYGEQEDFFTLKGILENLFAAFGVRADYAASAEPYFHPGPSGLRPFRRNRSGHLWRGAPRRGRQIRAGRARLCGGGGAAGRCLAAVSGPTVYKPLPRFPAVERDLALLCDDDLPVAEIEKAIRAAGGRYLESVRLFDVYRGAQITAGKKSVAYSLMFRSPEGTLTDAEIEPALKKIFKSLHEKGCILRS